MNGEIIFPRVEELEVAPFRSDLPKKIADHVGKLAVKLEARGDRLLAETYTNAGRRERHLVREYTRAQRSSAAKAFLGAEREGLGAKREFERGRVEAYDDVLHFLQQRDRSELKKARRRT